MSDTDTSGMDPLLFQPLPNAAATSAADTATATPAASATTPDTAATAAPDVAVTPNADVSDLLAQMNAPPPSQKGGTPPGGAPDSSFYGQFAAKMMQHESGGSSTAKNPRSTASGLGQFTDGTWISTVAQHAPQLTQGKTAAQVNASPALKAQVLALRTGDQNSAFVQSMIGAHAKDLGQQLDAAGIPVNHASLMGGWFLGPGGMTALFNADPNAPVTKVLGAGAAAANPKDMYVTDANGKPIRPRTVGELGQRIASWVGEDSMPHHLDAMSTAQLAAQSAVPDVEHIVGGLYEAAANPAQTWQGIQALGGAADSVLRGWAGETQDPATKAAKEQPFTNMGDDFHRATANPQSVLNTIGTQPVSTAMLAALPVGGVEFGAGKLADLAASGAEGLGDASAVGRSLGAVSDAARGAQGVAANVGRVLDPVRGIGDALSPTSFRATTMSGDIAPEVDAAIQRASGGAMSAADVDALPATQRRAFLNTIRAKGVSDAAVNEGLLKAQGLDAPRSLVTGEAPPDFARQAVADSRASNTYTIGDAAKDVSGAEAPHPYEMGAHLADAYANSHNAVRDQYDALAQMPGSFSTPINGGQLDAALAAEASKNLSTPVTDIGTYAANSGPQAAQALQLIRDRMVNGIQAFPGRGAGIDAPELMQLRRKLSENLNMAKGDDAVATRALINGWQGHVSDLANQGAFTAAGQPATGFIDGLKDANANYANHMGTFEEGPIGKAAAATGNTIDPATGRMIASTDADAQAQAQGMLARNLFHPDAGAANYNRLTDALQASPGGPDAVSRFVKQSVLQTDGGALAPSREVLRGMASPHSAVSRAYASDPQGLAQARLLHATHRINSQPFRAGSSHRATISGVAARYAARGAAGYVGDKIGGLPGFFVAQGLEHGAEKAMDAARMGREMRGAPKLGRHTLIGKAASAAHAVANPQNVAVERATRPQHAAGGKVEGNSEKVERLVGRLLSQAKLAKKASNASTEGLLHAPDEAIVKALAVAQRAI